VLSFEVTPDKIVGVACDKASLPWQRVSALGEEFEDSPIAKLDMPLIHYNAPQETKNFQGLWWGKKLFRLSGVILGAFRGASDHEEGFI